MNARLERKLREHQEHEDWHLPGWFIACLVLAALLSAALGATLRADPQTVAQSPAKVAHGR